MSKCISDTDLCSSNFSCGCIISVVTYFTKGQQIVDFDTSQHSLLEPQIWSYDVNMSLILTGNCVFAILIYCFNFISEQLEHGKFLAVIFTSITQEG